MKLIGLVRLGRDAEVRYTGEGTAVANLAGAYNYGMKDGEGKRPTQWVDLTLWGQRAESLGEWLVKGQQFFVDASDVHVETYDKNDGGVGVKLVGRIDSIEFAGPAPDRQQQGGGQSRGGGRHQGAQQQAGRGGGQQRTGMRQRSQQAAPQGRQQQRASTGFDDPYFDDIPS